jgi:hypothetical protein
VLATGTGIHAKPVTEHLDVVADPRSSNGEGLSDLFGRGAVRSGGQIGEQLGVVRLAFGDSDAMGAGPDRAEQCQPGQVAVLGKPGGEVSVEGGVGIFDGLPEPGGHPGARVARSSAVVAVTLR